MLRELVHRAPWPSEQLATAIWTLTVQDGARARGAKRALKRADACSSRVGRKIHVAAFTIRAHLQHVISFAGPNESSQPAGRAEVREKRAACRRVRLSGMVERQ